MNYRPKPPVTYKSQLTFLSVMTVLSVFGCIMLGYLFLPFAAGFYAALIATENKRSRVLSILIPIVMFVINICFNGFYSLEAFSYVIVALIISRSFNRSKTKASTAFFASAVLVLLMLISVIAIAFDSIKTLDPSALEVYFIDVYEVFKQNYVGFLTSFTNVADDGTLYQLYNPGDATAFYNTTVISLIPLSIISSFVSVGIALKIFTARIKRHTPDDIRLSGWVFFTQPLVAYSYLVISIISVFVSTGIFGIALSFISSIFMVVYLYMGATWLYKRFFSRTGILFLIIMLVLTLFFIIRFPDFFMIIIRIVSYVGVFVNNSIYKSENKPDVTV